MNQEQKKLARHALGLDQSRKGQSYRNRYSANPSTLTARYWDEMVAAGLAREIKPTFRQFEVTRLGAELALNQGEQLDPEDFFE